MLLMITLIDGPNEVDDAQRVKLINPRLIRDIGIDRDYQTVITMNDGKIHTVCEGMLEIGQTVGYLRVGDRPEDKESA